VANVYGQLSTRFTCFASYMQEACVITSDVTAQRTDSRQGKGRAMAGRGSHA